MSHVQNCVCRGRRSVRMGHVVPGVALCGSLSVFLAVAVALWPAARNVRAQDPNRPPPQLGTAPAAPAPPAVAVPVQVQKQQAELMAVEMLVRSNARRFSFTIDPRAPLMELLPVPPKRDGETARPLTEDLARVPEVAFQQPLARDLPPDKAQEQTALTIARINHLNQTKSDHFLEALLETRADLAGLPVAMGDACRTTGERSREFKHAVAMVRQALQGNGVSATFLNSGEVIFQADRKVVMERIRPAATAPNSQRAAPPPPPPPVAAATPVAVSPPPPADAANLNSFWERFNRACAADDQNAAKNPRSNEDIVLCARIAALMQVLAPESPALRLGLVKYLAGISHVEATRALARLAIFSAEDEIRAAAINALKVRRERDYTALLLQGLRYPLPAVARRASEAVVKLERTDLVPQLVNLLDEPDPRAPMLKEVNHKRVPVVREVVRINHHRNCLLCHSPGNTTSVSPDTLTAAVPVPSQPLPEPSQGYDTSSPDILVRVDVTYLRQDFSMRLPVADANPWPEMQRFDFLVRTRVLTDKEARAIEEMLGKRAPGVLSPYHRAVLAALRELTGRDTEPTPQAWRRLLGLAANDTPVIMARR
jgi:hypothetical protein